MHYTYTGIQYDHPALVKNYRGYREGKDFKHNYNWYDGVRMETGCRSPCGCNLEKPCDDVSLSTKKKNLKSLEARTRKN